MQDITVYVKDPADGKYMQAIKFDTGINFADIPDSVKVGFSYNGDMPMSIKNITVNGNAAV